jgi:sugar-specific transcriptional regulator TrmB
MIEQTLKNIGLTDNEIKLYLVLLKNGPSHSGEIIQKTEFQSSVVFHLLDKLIEKGIVGYMVENKKKRYSANDPSVFKGLLEEKEKELKKTKKDLEEDIIKLKNLNNSKEQETKAIIFRGLRGIQTIQNDLLNSAKEYEMYAARDTFSKSMPKYREYFKEARVGKKIKQRIILPEDKKKPNRKYQQKRYVPKENASPISLMLYNKKVIFFIWDSDPPLAIVLEGEKVSSSFKNMFELMWKSAKE